MVHASLFLGVLVELFLYSVALFAVGIISRASNVTGKVLWLPVDKRNNKYFYLSESKKQGKDTDSGNKLLEIGVSCTASNFCDISICF